MSATGVAFGVGLLWGMVASRASPCPHPLIAFQALIVCIGSGLLRLNA